MNMVLMTWPEVFEASQTGVMRMIRALQDNRKDAHGFKGDGWGIHIEGAIGERALAKYLGVYWDATVNTFKNQPDSAGCEVRTASEDNYSLIIREDDPTGSIFVLLVGKVPQFRVAGWIHGVDGKQQQWIRNPGEREPAWFVPQKELNTMDTFPLIEERREAAY